MNKELIHKLQYSYIGQNHEVQTLPSSLKVSLQLISDFFANNTTNKLCLVFPSKEFAAQWLSIPTVLFLIQNEFIHFEDKISETYKNYKPGDMLMLNNDAIVQWAGVKWNGVAFKTKGTGESSGAEITIRFSDIVMLQKAPASRKALSSLKSVKEALPSKNITPLDTLLNINTYGNREFIKNKVCLITKYKSFDDSIDNIAMNHEAIPDYFYTGKIDENGTADVNGPLLLSNSLTNLYLYLAKNRDVSKIVIDGYCFINEKGISEFKDIEALNLNIPILLITDLSEIEIFDSIGQFGFEFFNFTRENIKSDNQPTDSPFDTFNKKLKKYIHFNIVRERCSDSDIEKIIKAIESIEDDESNNDLNQLKRLSFYLCKIISGISHRVSTNEVNNLRERLAELDSRFISSRLWLGNSCKAIEESIFLLKDVIEKLALSPSQKCLRLESLTEQNAYDYIICPTENEAEWLRNSLPLSKQKQVISVADINDGLLINKPLKAILTGWAKANKVNGILSSFLFSEITILFYEFENRYYNSLQRRNQKCNDNIRSTISGNGIRSASGSEKVKGFDDLYTDNKSEQVTSETSFDIISFESKFEKAQYSKYTLKGKTADSIEAKRVDFESDSFTYASESHKFRVINELIETKGNKADIRIKKTDELKAGDVIARINTDRDILAELVEQNTNKQDLQAVKQWTNLWKNLLKEYFAANGKDLKRLNDTLQKHGCRKGKETIRAWLHDENRIGPDDDADLICIAILTNSKQLYENVGKVREAIRKMTGWRMKAADFISDEIKAKIHDFANSSIINKTIPVEGLGTVIVLKVIEVSNIVEDVDARYVNKLLKKELF